MAVPVPDHINTQHREWPSAGLAFTLAVIDDLTPGDLTGRHRVAVTGTIEPDGTIGPVGGVAQKAITAERNGATALIVPLDEAKDARGARRPPSRLHCAHHQRRADGAPPPRWAGHSDGTPSTTTTGQ